VYPQFYNPFRGQRVDRSQSGFTQLKVIKEKIRFPNVNGEMLAGYLERPVDHEPRAYGLFAHCFTCTKNIITATRIGVALAGEGLAVLRFDFTGLGDSEGEFSDTNLSSNIDDLVAAYRFLEQQYRAPTFAIGHSLGGAALILAAASMPATHAMVLIAVPDDPSHMHHLLRESRPEIEQKGWAIVEIGGSNFRITRQLMDDVRQHNLLQALAQSNRATLFMHSPHDQMVEIEHAYHLFDAARGNKSFITLAGADHLLSKPVHAAYAAQIIVAWLDNNDFVTGAGG
jgi:alpha-beta hydrolase superfamily lysophospholipase